MAPEILETDTPASLDDSDIPFEAPAGRTAPSRPRTRKRKRGSLIGLLAIVYALGAVAVGAVNHGGLYLLLWLVTGPLLFGIVRAFRARRS